MNFLRREVEVRRQSTTYAVHEPQAIAEPLPVILFLHGAGERGEDGLRPTTVGLGLAVLRDPARWPALIVFPQASQGYGWRGFNLAAAFAALDDVERHYRTDKDRVYVSGISMGGYGTWLAAYEHPDRFAAVVPVCGGMDRNVNVAEAAPRLKDIPHWVFHGEADDIIPVDESRAMVNALRAAGADVHYTEYAGVRHNSWDAAYAEPELAPWLLRQRRGV
jgi:predicted peptidase